MITSLKVQNFRSHIATNLDFKPGVTVITGPNGSGKTSLIEAIYIALTGKSWRSNFNEILRSKDSKTADWWRIDLKLSDNEERVVKFQHGEKSFLINNKQTARLPTKSKKPVVLFEPNDLQLLYGSPSRRRDFFDRFITQLSPEHQTNLNKFERVLRQRNNLLKQNTTRDELFVWDLQFSDLSEKISQARRDIIKKISENLNAKYNEIAGVNSQVSIKFIPGGPLDRQEILKQLSQDNFPFQTTPIGAQKDEFKFILNQKNAKLSASRGENRTIIFAILATQVEILREVKREVFVILDDIDSELDQTHKDNLYRLSSLSDNNLFATTLTFKSRVANHIKLV